MYVNLGRGCIIQSGRIIGIFCAGEYKDFYKTVKNGKGEPYKVEDLSEDGETDSIIFTEETIYLSPISALTLQKRINKNIIFNNGGNNDRKK